VLCAINLCSQVVDNLKNILLILNKIFFTIPNQYGKMNLRLELWLTFGYNENV
jgi:hypothetical protein